MKLYVLVTQANCFIGVYKTLKAANRAKEHEYEDDMANRYYIIETNLIY